MLSAETSASTVIAESVNPVNPLSSRPTEFFEHYIAIRPVPYRFVQSSKHPSSSGGVLRAGQAIWLEAAIQRTRLPAVVQAFVENVGLVSLDPHLIRRGDGSLLRS